MRLLIIAAKAWLALSNLNRWNLEPNFPEVLSAKYSRESSGSLTGKIEKLRFERVSERSLRL